MEKSAAKKGGERIAKIIANAGIASRRNAEDLIRRGKVSINGEPVRDPAVKANPNADIIEVEGELLDLSAGKIYIALNKPRGYITSVRDPEGRPTIMKLLPEDLPRLYPVGRLDWDSEGLLLLTNDGEFTNAMLHPGNKVTKTYEVKVKGVAQGKQIVQLKKGILLRDGEVKPLQIKMFKVAQKNSWIRITITSGKKHIVKRMMEVVGLEVIRLKRVEMAGLMLGNLGSGKWTRIKPKEIKRVWANILLLKHEGAKRAAEDKAKAKTKSNMARKDSVKSRDANRGGNRNVKKPVPTKRRRSQ